MPGLYLDQASLPAGTVQVFQETDKPDPKVLGGRNCYVVESGTKYWSNGEEWLVEAGSGLGASREVTYITVALGILGQSNELGATCNFNATANKYFYGSAAAPSQGIFEPVKLAPQGFGSMFTYAADLLARDGISVRLMNGSLGGASMLNEFTGFAWVAGRANSTNYRGKRTASLGAGDLGHRGDFVFENGRLYECTVGRSDLAFLDSLTPIMFNGVPYYSTSSIVRGAAAALTAASKPTFSASAIVGDTVVDGAITWTCVSSTTTAVDHGNGLFVFKYDDSNFDPYYACARLATELVKYGNDNNPAPLSPRNQYVYLQNGQSDAGILSALYTRAVAQVAAYFSNKRISVICGLSVFSTTIGQAAYDTLETSFGGGGLASTPDYINGPISTMLSSMGFGKFKNPSDVDGFFGNIYFGTSLYRALGTSIDGLLYPNGPARIHVNSSGMVACAKALAPRLSKILRRSD
ncbi:hypothetical protein [Deefgea sp. CFH1-16]|uniref:hypothetical protein n=1 Tax=Deefgea sp. CFH1-16 TaxID=2675457 RepID=UPI0015F63B5A|nr:hypothetical protein [Deefgea sp. CFH1-16]MBM5575849.1 hypothetical protein [Deefgea sp. CFH1-16]